MKKNNNLFICLLVAVVILLGVVAFLIFGKSNYCKCKEEFNIIETNVNDLGNIQEISSYTGNIPKFSFKITDGEKDYTVDNNYVRSNLASYRFKTTLDYVEAYVKNTFDAFYLKDVLNKYNIKNYKFLRFYSSNGIVATYAKEDFDEYYDYFFLAFNKNGEAYG